MTGRVTNEQVLAAIDRYHAETSSQLDKVEHRLSEDIKTVKADGEKDIARVEAKVEKLQLQTRNENIAGSVISAIVAFVGSIIYVNSGGSK